MHKARLSLSFMSHVPCLQEFLFSIINPSRVQVKKRFWNKKNVKAPRLAKPHSSPWPKKCEGLVMHDI
jgi:hypothetical protein